MVEHYGHNCPRLMHCPEIRGTTFLHIFFTVTALSSRKGNPSPVLLKSSDVLVILELNGFFEQISNFTFLQFYVT